VYLDRSHRRWIIVAGTIFLFSAAAYVPYSWLAPLGPKGGSLPGLLYGIAGFGLMLFAALLGLRKKFPVWRIGKAQTWMRGHLWLGLLSVPLVLFHAGFALGGTLSSLLMVLLVIVAVSGVFGAVLQHYLPRMMTQQLPMETIFEQIDSVRQQLSKEAELLINNPATRREQAPLKMEKSGDPMADLMAMAAKLEAMGVATDQAATVLLIQPAPPATDSLRTFYELEVKPFLEHPRGGRHLLRVPAQARLRFQQLRTMAPPELHDMVNDLESICEEARQLERQAKLHHLLHGWLLVHIPLSYALLLLSAVHGVMALRF
jgi:hypothetical protein